MQRTRRRTDGFGMRRANGNYQASGGGQPGTRGGKIERGKTGTGCVEDAHAADKELLGR